MLGFPGEIFVVSTPEIATEEPTMRIATLR
jgi:hypothetical protein